MPLNAGVVLPESDRAPSMPAGPAQPARIVLAASTGTREIFFGIITRQAIRRGTFTWVKDLITAIEDYSDGWNERCQPFTWTKTAGEILARATGGQRTSFTRR